MTAMLRRIPFRFSRDQIIAAVAYSLTMILFVTATKMTTAANAILLQYTNPVFVILFGYFFLDEKTDVTDILTVLGVLGGLALFFSGDSSGALFRSGNLGIILALGSGLTFGICTVFLRRQKEGRPEDSLILAHFLTFAFSVPFWFTVSLPDMKSTAGLLLLGIFQVGLPSILYARGLTRITAVSAVLITMIEPVMNPVWVALFYKEFPSVQAVCGGAVILFFIFLRVFIKNRQSVRSGTV
jgi:drug/metabolite transporter (DMT)-like permease